MLNANGWSLLVKRLRTERRGDLRARTIGSYQVYHNGIPATGPALSGATIEREGPGDNGDVGKTEHRCIEAGLYPLAMHDTENYATVNYESDGDHPRPAFALRETVRRTGILVHPAAGYGSTIGCFNLGERLDDASSNLDLMDSTRRVIALIDDLKTFLGGQLPTSGPLPNCRVLVEDPPLDQIGSQLLRRGSRGPLVKAWEAFLVRQGFSSEPPDGQFGSGTETATRAFQSAHRLSADGKVGPRTIAVARTLGFGEAGDYARAAAMAAAASPDLTADQRLICERIINVYETGSIEGDYSNITIYPDGPHDMRQITYGRAQTTEYGNLAELVRMYVEAGGTFASQLRPFVRLIKHTPLVDNAEFKLLLRRAGREDPVMAETQDVFFDKRYFRPAQAWASSNGFTRALSMLVIYDSFIQSGGILPFLRARFPEKTPAGGGNENEWIRQYVDVRHDWLAGHSKPILRRTIYRTRDSKREIGRDNWDLALLPVSANGTLVTAATGSHRGMDASASDPDEIPYLGNPDLAQAAAEERGDEAEIWCEDRFVPDSRAASAETEAAETGAQLAARILGTPAITLATGHISGVVDQANARKNMEDTAAGRDARRSSYGNAPGGTVALNRRMLSGMLSLAERYTYAITELCGGSHSPNSRHYAGIAIDVGVVNGQTVRSSHPDVRDFMRLCRSLGATEVLGPGNANHDHHVHAAWPRT